MRKKSLRRTGQEGTDEFEMFVSQENSYTKIIIVLYSHSFVS